MTTEVWRDIQGYEGLYQVSSHGRVKSLKRGGRLVVLTISKFGYQCISLYKKYHRLPVKVHRLVAEAFIPNTENKSQVNHKDGNKTNNHYSNLEWVTPSENISHAYKNGLKTKQHLYGRAKLTIESVNEIRSLSNKMNRKHFAEKYGVSVASIKLIEQNKTWNHVTN
jgi:hypothetical protein